MIKTHIAKSRKEQKMNMFQEIKDAVSAKEAASFYGLKIGRGRHDLLSLPQ
jgi:hypothetical protein